MTYYAYDNSRCNGDVRYSLTHGDYEATVQPLCTRCLRYMTREDVGPRTPFMQGSVVDGKCELYVKEKE